MAINKAATKPLSAGGARPLELGDFRQRRGLSLESIAETTKISTRFLRAIEDGQYAILPGGIFNTSYLRQYAAAVGYEESTLLDHYRCVFLGEARADEDPPDQKRPRGGWFGWLTAQLPIPGGRPAR